MEKTKQNISAIQRAVNACSGNAELARNRGQAELARILGVTPQAVQQWVAAGVAPPKRAIGIENATGGKVTRHDLAPEFYPHEAV